MMEESSNFVPLGTPKGQRSLDNDKPQSQKVVGTTKEERKRIATEIRKAHKKEKKLIKADAKRQRKQNAIMHRRMTKNPEKYTKNKERNRLRAIEAERQNIRREAVQQAQRLAAKHDPSGKTFNVGEVVTLADGTVKSKEALANAELRKAQREAAKEQKENPDPSQEPPKKSNVSKRQQQLQAALQPRPPPPRPVLPEGITVPEGEENFIAMWDIAEEQIQRRLSDVQRKKRMARKDLRKQQKAQKKINKAMKLLKRQTENRGVQWDPIEGRKIVMKQQEAESKEESDDSSENDDSEDSGPDREQVKIEAIVTLEKAEPPVEPIVVGKEPKKSKKAKKDSHPASSDDVVELPAPTPRLDPKQGKSSKRAAEDALVDERNAKKTKKSKKSGKSETEPGEGAETMDAAKLEPTTTDEKKTPTKEERHAQKEQKRAQKEEKKAQKEKMKKQRQEEPAEATKSNPESIKSSKKRRHEDDAAEAEVEDEKSYKKKKKRDLGDSSAERQSGLTLSLDRRDKYCKHVVEANEEPVKESHVAAQWNSEALTGEAARKEKFLRLLGAGKANAKAADGVRHKSSANLADISKVESDLERQYEAGMKMKHDGGGKRRGLGA